MRASRLTERRRAAAAAQAGFRPDHGATGPAQLARPSRIVETQAAGVTVRRMEPAQDGHTHPLDHYEAAGLLTEREINAGVKLTRLYRRGYPREHVTADLIGARGGILSDETAEQQAAARFDYACAMERVPYSCRQTIAEIVRGEWPRRTHALRYVREGLGAAADFWRMPRESS